MWQKYITRRLAVQVAQAWNFGWGRAMKKVYGLSLPDTLVFRDQKKTEYYVGAKQHKKYVQGLYRLLDDSNFIKNFHKQAKTKLENILKITTKRFNQDFTKLSNQNLVRLYKNFILPNQEQFYVRMWTVFNIGEPLANLVTRKLTGLVADKNKLVKYSLKLSSPLKPNDVIKERINLLKLAQRRSKISRESLLKELQVHARKYQHIPMFDFDHTPYSKKHFLNELQKIRNPKKELTQINRMLAEQKKDFQKIIANLKPDKKFKKLLIFLKENVFLRDYRDMIRQKYNLQLRKYYQEVGKRFGLNVEQVATLTNDEIIKYLNLNKKFPKKEIEKRQLAYLLIQKDQNVAIFSGKSAIVKAKSKLQFNKIKTTKEISGIIGSVGKKRGKVKIVYTNKDLSKVKRGNILISPITRQDFIIAIRKAAAIVTDEGSITCHAAIIARELNKPCVVGTKIATKALKDGDTVEVDANNGIVKKIPK